MPADYPGFLQPGLASGRIDIERDKGPDWGQAMGRNRAKGKGFGRGRGRDRSRR